MLQVRTKMFALAAALAACGDSGGGVAVTPDAPPTTTTIDAPPAAVAVLKRPSKSATVAISDDDQRVLMVNPEDNSVSLFTATDDTLVTKIPVGKEPSSVVIAPDGKTAYVSNRADATVMKITGIDTASPSVSGTVGVGSEPTGVALSPTGARLYVAEYAEGRIAVIDTASMTESAFIKGKIQHPHAVAVTNNGNADDDDEFIIVPEFFGEPTDQANDAATLDKSRQGRVRIYDSATLTPGAPIFFASRDGKIVPDAPNITQSVFYSPNQLWSVGVRRIAGGGTKLYIPSVSAAPAPPVRYNGNVYPVVLVGDLDARAEDVTATGSVNLAERVLAGKLVPDTDPTSAGQMGGKLFLSDIVDLDFLPVSGAASESNVAYVVSRGADAIQRVAFDDQLGAVIGSSANLQIDLIGPAANVLDGCKGPNGIILRNDGAKAYVNCWVSHRLGVVALGSDQKLVKTIEAYTNDDALLSINKGRRFFVTGRGRWSGNAKDNGTTAPTLNGLAWGDCASCHPDGLSDNITWIFGAGARQTTALDGTFSKGAVLKQRALNWSGINDELHDFERNTRDTSGGLGAITTSDTCGNLATETRQALGGQLGQPVRELQATTKNCQHDWDDIEGYVKTIRPPVGLKKSLDPQKVALGAQIFGDGTATDRAACVRCHGGPAFTVSRIFYPQTTPNTAALADATTGLFTIVGTPLPAAWNVHTRHIENERFIGEPTAAGLPPAEVSCGIRKLDTFGPAALEKKQDLTAPSEGQGGFNVPSLYGMSLGAPYLHSGAAETLDELFANFPGHLKAGNDNFSATAEQLEALKQYVLSIDASTDEPEVPAGFDVCPTIFP
jgi:YVTN family beta-propeller protein